MRNTKSGGSSMEAGQSRKWVAIFASAMMLVSLVQPAGVNAASGSIWTTADDCGSAAQNVNQYNVGEHVYINGENFDASTEYEWSVKGQPGSSDPDSIVASGTFMTDTEGAFCFDAYVVLGGDDGVYKVNFGDKNDNYNVGSDDEEVVCPPTGEARVEIEGCDEEEEGPSGTVQITKYNCPEGLDFDNTLSSTAKPDASGDATVPAECVPAAGYSFGYIHEPDKTDNTAPYIGRETADPFTTAPGVTNASGVLTISGLPNGGRHDLVELDGSSQVADSEIYGFMCMEDTGTKSDNYDIVFNETGKTSYCNVYNKIAKPTGIVIEADKVVCLTEPDLPNWGNNGVQTGEPALIDSMTAADYVAASNGRCWLEEDWSFQYGFAEKDNTSGVHKLYGDHLGEADGTSTMGACHPTYCGVNTETGTGYADWKTFDTTTSAGGAVSAAVNIEDLEGAPGVWVRENLKAGYVPFTYPPQAVPGSDVSAEIYCHNDIQNYDNYDEVILPSAGGTYHCVAFNAIEGATIEGDKVVCLTEADLPNWGDDGAQVGEPPVITGSTAAEYVANSNQRCWLEEDWSFQYGFATKEGSAGVHKLYGNHIGQADGTPTTGECDSQFCGTNTDTGTGYGDWKNFDAATSGSGAISASVTLADLEDAPGIWVRENLQEGYVPFTYPPDGAPGSNVSAEIYCHDDIQNYDNYDEIVNPIIGETYNCVAFNAIEGTTIKAAKVVCLTEADLPNWGDNGAQAGEPAMITVTTAEDYVANSDKQCWLEEDWSFQYGFAEKDNTSGVHKLYGNHIGEADGTPTTGECHPTYCGVNTDTGTGYADWKTFDTSTSANGVISAVVSIPDLEGAPGIWVRENLQEGYVPFSYPPDEVPGSNVSAELYCHTDIQNYDNYDEVILPSVGNAYYCVAFNALEEDDDTECEVNCGGGGNVLSSISSQTRSSGGGGGGGFTPTPTPSPTPGPDAGGDGSILGSSTTNFLPQVLGASTELPRTGGMSPTWMLLAVLPFLFLQKEVPKRSRKYVYSLKVR